MLAIPVEISVAIIGFASVIASAAISAFVSRKIAKTEIEKMEITWAHDRVERYEIEFSEMLTAVKVFTGHQSRSEQKDAVAKLNLVRIKSTGEIAAVLDLLYGEIAYADATPMDRRKVESLLSQLVDKKRISDGH